MSSGTIYIMKRGDKMGLGKRLIQARESRGYKQNQLAELLCISATRLNYWEKDKREPDTESINKLAKVLGVTDNFLLGFGVFKNWEEIFSKKNVIIEILYTTLPQLKQFDLSNDIIFICILDSIIEKIEIDGNNIRVCFKTYLEDFSESKAVEKNQLSVQEKQYIEQYRILDEYGKKAVDSVLSVEYERCIQTQQNNSKIS